MADLIRGTTPTYIVDKEVGMSVKIIHRGETK